MNGLAKLASFEQEKRASFEKDPTHKKLSDEADSKWNDHRLIQRKVKLKEKKNERKWTGVTGLAGSAVGGLLGKKSPQSKAVGAALGGMIGAGIGYGLADLSFEHFNKDVIGQEALAKRDFDRAQHRLFNYEMGKKASDESDPPINKSIVHWDEDDWFEEQRKIHPEYDKLLTDYGEKQSRLEELNRQLDPVLREKARKASNRGMGIGASLGGLAGLGAGVGTGYLNYQGEPGVLNRILQAGSMAINGGAAGVLGSMGGGLLGAVAAEPFVKHYEKQQQQKNPELAAQIEAAERASRQADNAVAEWEYDNFY